MQIEIPEPLFRRLQNHATPLVDTTLTVIEKLTDFYERHNTQRSVVTAANSKLSVSRGDSDIKQFDPLRPPSLLHTRVRGEFGDLPFSNWNDLLRIAHVESFKQKARSFEELRKATIAQIKNGEHSYDGYRYIPEIDLSLQGVDAVRAWNYAIRLAQYLKVPLKAEVEWRQNDKAAFPGKRGYLQWLP